MPSNSSPPPESDEYQTAPAGCFGKSVAAMTATVSMVYLANFTMGIWELPDNIPIIGNLDEVFFSGLLFSSLGYLGIHLPFLRFPMRRQQIREEDPEQQTTVESQDPDLK